jgi:putative ABC transport system ATP-binding protein
MSVLVLQDVTKRYGAGPTEVVALDHVSLAVEPGELVAIMGPSGSGKSTVLHVAGGLEPASLGQVTVAGRDLATLGPTALATLRRRQVGFVFQRYNLVPSLSAMENVLLPLEFDGRRGRAARLAATDALERVGLSRPFDRFPDDLSGGEQQRVAIARAVAGARELILADEPTGALDTITGDLVMELLAELRDGGTAVVLVTHEPRYASWADRVVFLRDGAVVDQSVPASLPVPVDAARGAGGGR